MVIKQHARAANLAKAGGSIGKSVADISQTYGLTTTEVVAALAQVQSRWVNYLLRDERKEHPERN